MSEFKIKVNVELDADDLKSKLEKLGGDNEIDLKINTNTWWGYTPWGHRELDTTERLSTADSTGKQ